MSAIKHEPKSQVTPEVLRTAAKGLLAITAGGGMGYVAGKLLARRYGPGINPAHMAAMGTALSALATGATMHQNKVFTELLNNAREDK